VLLLLLLQVSQIKRVTAERLLQSKLTIPHYYLTMECEVRGAAQQTHSRHDCCLFPYHLAGTLLNTNKHSKGHGLTRQHDCTIASVLSVR
jgi:hypothetical protein